MSRFSNIHNPSYHHFQVGHFDCLVLSDGSLSVDMAGCYPGSDEQARNALLNYYGLPINPFSMDINTLLVDTGEHLVLIDTGLGETGLFGGTGGRQMQRLDELGIKADEIDLILITHGHADHFSGLVDEDGTPRFGKANIQISKTDFDYWTDDALLKLPADTHDGMCARGIRKSLLPYGNRISFLEHGRPVVAGITPIETAGHTPGHHSFLIESAGQALLDLGDASHHSVIEPAFPDWKFGYDIDSDAGTISRKKCFDMVASNDYQILGYHFPWPGLGRIVRDGSAYRFIPSPNKDLFASKV